MYVRGDLCRDGIQNRDETDIDCGGETCGRCEPLQGCRINADCTSGTCQAGACLDFESSCRAIRRDNPTATSGTYTIDPDGATGPAEPTPATCIMNGERGETLTVEPDALDGLQLWLDAADYDASQGRWPDRSLLGLDLTQSVGARRPSKLSAERGIGDLPAVSFSSIEPCPDGDCNATPRSCAHILARDGSAASGLYSIDPDGPGPFSAISVYCDMVTDGGGWTLVLLNSPYAAPPQPSYDQVVNNVNVTGTFGTDLTQFDLFLGVKYWSLLGSQMMLMQGSGPSALAHKAKYTFSLNANDSFRLNMSNEQVDICTTGTCSSGMFTYHNGRPLTTHDRDSDAYGSNCSHLYENTAWWFGACWSGSFWGGGRSSYTNNPYWTGSGGEYFPWGAIWVRDPGAAKLLGSSRMSSIYGNRDRTIFAVVRDKGTGLGVGENIVSTNDAPPSQYNDGIYDFKPTALSTTGLHGWQENGDAVGAALPGGTPVIVTATYAGATWQERRDGLATVTETVSFPNSPQGYVAVGKGVQAPGHDFDGDLAEVIVYNRQLSDQERNQIEGYLAWKYRLQASLPSDHPYRNSNPNPISRTDVCTDGVKNFEETDVDCGGPCAPCAAGKRCESGGGCESGVCHLPSCLAVLRANPGAPSGVYTLDPDGPGGEAPYQAYCEMEADGGGWTLALKVDGAKNTFAYGSPLWTNTEEYRPDEPGLTTIEAKLKSYRTLPVRDIRLGMYSGGQFRWLTFRKTGSSLRDILAGGTTVTNLGRAAWTGLLLTPSTQSHCNREGINLDAGFRARFGFVMNNENDCDSPESVIGIGLDQGVTAGNYASCCATPFPTAEVAVPAYVFVRESDADVTANDSATCTGMFASCLDVASGDPSAPSGIYRIDPDGPGGNAPFSVYCDLETDGGGWTLVFKTDNESFLDRSDSGFNRGALTSAEADASGVLPRNTIQQLGGEYRLWAAARKLYWRNAPFYVSNLHQQNDSYPIQVRLSTQLPYAAGNTSQVANQSLCLGEDWPGDPAAHYMCVQRSTGLVAYYKFSSDLLDSSGSNLHLSGSGGTFRDGGLSLDGSDLYTSPVTSILNTDSHTIAFYMRYDAPPDGGWRRIFGYMPSGTDRSPGIWKYPNSMALHWRYDPSNTGVGEGYIYEQGRWYYVVGVKEGGTFRLYVDGVQIASGGVSNPKTPGNAALQFGEGGYPTAPVTLKEFRVFNRALSPAEVGAYTGLWLNGGEWSPASYNPGLVWARKDRCSDGVKNFDESDVDCGGSCGQCQPTQSCRGHDDCQSGICEAGVCSAYKRSCIQILDAAFNAGTPVASGTFTIDPDGLGGLDPFPVECDMETDGGGWTILEKSPYGDAVGRALYHDVPVNAANPATRKHRLGRTQMDAIVARTDEMMLTCGGSDYLRTSDDNLFLGEGGPDDCRNHAMVEYDSARLRGIEKTNLAMCTWFVGRNEGCAGAWHVDEGAQTGYCGAPNYPWTGAAFTPASADNFATDPGTLDPQSDCHKAGAVRRIMVREDRCTDGVRNFSGLSQRRSCADILAANPGAPSGMYEIFPKPGVAVTAYCDMETDGGGYTMVPVADGMRTYRSTDDNSCKALGMDVVIPRTREHWRAMLQKYGAGYFQVIPGITKPTNGGNYSAYAMKSGAVPDWQALDGGGWWLRDTPFSEPSGNYVANCWLEARNVSSADALDFADADCSASTTTYLCSTNDKDGPVEPVPGFVESDVDCGGVCAPCTAGQQCTTGADCESGVCSGGTCSAPLASCLDVLNAYRRAPSRVYTLDPDDIGPSPPFQTYCDMESEGGGWTMVLLNSPHGTPPRPTLSQAINQVSIQGTLDDDLMRADALVGLRYWALLGNELMVTAGNRPDEILRRNSYTFSLASGNNYALSLRDEVVHQCEQAPREQFGNGADGACQVTAGVTLDLTEQSCSGRATADGIVTTLNQAVTAGAASLNVASVTGLRAGDEIVVIELWGSASESGRYETARIQAVSGSSLTLDAPLTQAFNPAERRVAVQRIPNYTDVRIASGGTLTARAWNGAVGGLLAFRASGVVEVDGTITMSGKGYRGGAAIPSWGVGYGGESPNRDASARTPTRSMGGAGGGDAEWCHSGQGGGGGGYGTNGAAGKGVFYECGGGWAGGRRLAEGGGIYGAPDLSLLLMGSGGGSGGVDGDNPDSGGAAGNGGGMVWIGAETFNLGLTGSIAVNGAAGSYGNGETGGGGGGAGGSVYLQVRDGRVGANRVTALGGSPGGAGRPENDGGNGGDGRVFIEYGTLTGATLPLAGTAAKSFSKSCSPGLYTYHNGLPFSAYDVDNDSSRNSCSQLYGQTPWWYGSCWEGSFWGGGGGASAFANEVYWAGNTAGEQFPWGAIWARRSRCSDGVQNFDETDIDCGGDTCGACAPLGLCEADTDCESGRCEAGVCSAHLSSCRELNLQSPATPSGVYWVDYDGPGGENAFETYCDMSAAGGGWTLIGSMVNQTDARDWDRLEDLTSESMFGSVAERRAGGFKSGLWSRLAARDVLFKTSSYAFGFENLLKSRPYAEHLRQDWPEQCNVDWQRSGADFVVGLGSTQRSALGYLLRPKDSNGGCYGLGAGETVAVGLAAADCCMVNGLANDPRVGNGWRSHDASLPRLFAGKRCATGYPCNDLGYVYDGQTCLDASCKQDWVEVYVREGGCADASECASGVCESGTCGAYRESCSQLLIDAPGTPSGEYTIDPDGSGPGEPIRVLCDMENGGGQVVWQSCLRAKAAIPSAADGVYTVDPDGAGGAPPFEAYCDMTTDGGGWTFVANITNQGDAANTGNWLHTSPSPNAWESSSASFGAPDPALNADYRGIAFHRLPADQLMITHRNQFLLRTSGTCLGGRTLQSRFASLGWTCGGSAALSGATACANACVIEASTPRAGDTALLAGSTRSHLYLKAGEADGAQDSNKDRAYLSTSYRDNVDYPTGLGAFCSGGNCTPRTGEADVNDRADAIQPTAGAEFYGVWVREDHCQNGVRDFDETDADCGGSCGLCNAGQNCDDYTDCKSSVCQEGICGNYEKSCLQILTSTPSAGDGTYTIDPDGNGGVSPFGVYCDMDDDGGGWTLAAKSLENNADWYYASPLWTTNSLLNSQDFSMGSGNAKYGSFNHVKVKSLRMVMNSQSRVYSAFSEAPSLLSLMSGSGTYFSQPRVEGVYTGNGVGTSLWGISYSGHEGYICRDFGVNVNFYGPDANRARIGYQLSQEFPCGHPGTSEGMGMYVPADDEKLGSGRLSWSTEANYFSPAFVYVREDHCSDGRRNRDETEVDCGGSCGKCDGGQECVADEDCLSGACGFDGVCSDLVRASCLEILLDSPGIASGIYAIDGDGEGGTAPFEVYCDMTNDGGGWTLVLKADGTKGTFAYGSNQWTSVDLLNPAFPGRDDVEAKVRSFLTVPVAQVRLEMKTAGDTRSGVVDYVTASRPIAASAYNIFANNAYYDTNKGRNFWKSLVPNSSLQPNCNKEGFNAQHPYASIRVGIIANQENDCASPDSRIGIGGSGSACGQEDSNSVGNEATCSADNGDRHIRSFGYLYVREQKRCTFGGECSSGVCDVDGLCVGEALGSCREIRQASPSAPDGLYTIDPDGSGPQLPVVVYCDMTTDGGGWTLASYGHTASTSTSGSNANHRSLKCGGGSWNPSSRANAAAAIPAVELARRSTEMAISMNINGGTVTSGGMSSYERAYKWAIPDPSKVTFVSHSYASGNWGSGDSQTGPCVPVTVQGIRGSSGVGTRYLLRNSLGVSWTDSYPTGYGVSSTSNCVNHDGGPMVTSFHTGQGWGGTYGTHIDECDVTHGSIHYVHRGNYTLESVNTTGASAIWFR